MKVFERPPPPLVSLGQLDRIRHRKSQLSEGAEETVLARKSSQELRREWPIPELSLTLWELPREDRSRGQLAGTRPPSNGRAPRLQTLPSQMAKVERGKTVWKLLRTSQPPHHEPRHRGVDEGLSGCARPLVVFGHPPVVADPREGAL